MNWSQKIENVQAFLQKENLDGWLLYDFKRLNPLACAFLEIPDEQHLTRRFFYWIPKIGEPVKLVSTVENPLDKVPGKTVRYFSHQALEKELAQLLQNSQKIAMEYSPKGDTPEVSKVDGGTLELVRAQGVEVVSSGDLYQVLVCVWDQKQLQSHLEAAQCLDETAAATWKWIKERLLKKERFTEYEVQQFILSEIERRGFWMDSPPIAAVNAHSADPHSQKSGSSIVQRGDFILIDLWCKRKETGSVFADITRVAVAREHPTEEEQKIFEIVKQARNAAVQLVKDRMHAGEKVFGWEVDKAARDVITQAGYGDYFVHRTGHNIHEAVHGPGAHNDSLETKDRRELIKGTCCSIEPGIYLPGRFGVRLEFDLYIHRDGKVEVTGGIQDQIECLF